MSLDEDTDILLATLSSLLDSHSVDQSVLLETLVNSGGDVERAARTLNASSNKQRPQATRQKRKREGLDGWLGKDTKSKSKKSTLSSDSEKHTRPAVVFDPNEGITDRQKPQIHSEAASPSISRNESAVDLMSVLRQAPTAGPSAPRLPPLTLATPEAIAKHTPCTMHYSILPPELACRLFYAMVDLSTDWQKNKWWLFDRVVESPHLTSFFARSTNGIDGDDSWQEAAQFWYNGRHTEPPATFPPVMEEACEMIERIVNEEMRKRKRYPLEWNGSGPEGQIWRANVAASNCYRGGQESVGPHSDQLTYLGPYPTIASLSLGANRIFRLREVIPTSEKTDRQARTFNIPLPHNSLSIMHASCQERFKHSIPPQSALDLYHPAYPHPSATDPSIIEPSNIRINITFRFYRPDFTASTTPRCKCGVPAILRPDMKNRHDGKTDRFWWICYAGAQNDGKGCNFWKVMDMKSEGRGPVVGDATESNCKPA